MRPSSLGGAAYCVALCLSVCLSVCPSVPLSDVVYSRTVLRANIQNRKTSVFAYGPATRMYFSARAEGRISYGHLGRTNSCFTHVRVCMHGVVIFSHPVEYFTFVLTDINSQFKFGFCRLSSGSLPHSCLCFVRYIVIFLSI